MNVTRLVLVLATALLALGPSPAEASAIYLVVPGRLPSVTANVEALLGRADVGRRYCAGSACRVVTTSSWHELRLRQLQAAGSIYMYLLEDAAIVYFPGTAYDFASGSFTHWIDGLDDLPADEELLAVVHFEGYPVDAFKALAAAGVSVLRHLPQDGRLVYGSRLALQTARSLPFVDGVLEIPAGPKRVGVDRFIAECDPGGPHLTSVQMVDFGGASSPARDYIVATFGSLPYPLPAYSGLVSYNVFATPEQGMALSRFAEVYLVDRRSGFQGFNGCSVNGE